MMFKFRPTYCFMLTSALVLGGCTLPDVVDMTAGGSSEYKAGSSEDLLAAEGEWKLVEEKRSPSPVQKHMNSRGQVQPAQTTRSGHYTESVKNMHVDEDIHFRVLRLERQMDTVRGDLDKVMPRFAALPKVKPDIKHDVKAAPAKKVVAHKKKVVKKTPVSGGDLRVVGVRVGVHPGKVRLVMDVSGAPKFMHDLDNAEKLLLVELPKTGWSAAAVKDFKGSALLKSYSVKTSDDGTSRLAIELKKAVKVGMAKVYEPNAVRGHRIVFDLSAL